MAQYELNDKAVKLLDAGWDLFGGAYHLETNCGCTAEQAAEAMAYALDVLRNR